MKSKLDFEYDLNVISTEAFANPFALAVPAIKNSLSNIANSFSKLFKTTNKAPIDNATVSFIQDYDVLYKNQSEFKNKLLDVSYGYIRELMIDVPTGYRGNVLKLHEELNLVSRALWDTNEEVLVPLHKLVLKYLSNPELINSIAPADFKVINLHDKEIDRFKGFYRKNFNLNLHGNHVKAKFGDCYRNLDEYFATNDLALNRLLPAYEQFRTHTYKMIDTQKQVTKDLDILLMRIEQNKGNVNNLGVERLAKLITAVAEELEMHASINLLLEETLITTFETYKEIKIKLVS